MDRTQRNGANGDGTKRTSHYVVVQLFFGILSLSTLAWPTTTAQTPESVAWRNGAWFDGTGFRRVDVYSSGERLTLKSPAKTDRAVDLAGKFLVGAFGEAHNHNIPGGDVPRTIRTYLEQGIFYAMIQTNVPQAAALRGLLNRPDSLDVQFANGGFTAPAGHPTALVRRNVTSGSMSTEDLDGGFLHPVRSREDIDRAWSARIRRQHPDFIKLTLVYSEDRVAGLPRPDSDRHGLDPSLAPYLGEGGIRPPSPRLWRDRILSVRHPSHGSPSRSSRFSVSSRERRMAERVGFVSSRDQIARIIQQLQR